MNKTVISYEEAQKMLPILKSRFGLFIIKKLFHWLDFDKVNQIYANHCELRGSTFTSAMLSDPLMDVRYEVHNREVLDSLPEGAFLTVSNHPIGSLDGIILIDIFASIRSDYRLMVNELLARIKSMGDNFISVIPKKGEMQDSNSKNINGVRQSFSHLKNGHPMGFFPSGSMSFYNKKQKRVLDKTWSHTVIRLIRKANVPVIPVYFDCLNTNFFYFLGRVSWKIRQFWVAIEAFNKKGQTFNVYLGQPILPEKIKTMPDDNALADFLYHSTYNSKGM